MTDEDDIDGLAAEYVLGSLSPEERREVDARRGSERALNEAVAAWQRRLEVLDDWVPGEEPPAHLFDSIAARIWEQDARAASAVSLQRTIRHWRTATFGASALAAALAIAVAWVFPILPASPTALVAVLQRSSATYTADESPDAKGPPGFVVTIDVKTRHILVSPVAVRPMPSRTYELWLIPQGGDAPFARAHRARGADGSPLAGSPPACRLRQRHARHKPGARGRLRQGSPDRPHLVCRQAHAGRTPLSCRRNCARATRHGRLRGIGSP